ncbi:GlxA family transcriptional regulator [Shewanella cyperi]|uniref:GlxA family transcriptional regulator n=1 Tax=Shewanella cyperi TaxID=2814292 RepID=UPI001A9444F5|nr:helix-turn-helix domain-containing protein [Shewanella cyperi]QSX41980.1 helix-turn-helix domain-containing protein [Shewanella cyperi]
MAQDDTGPLSTGQAQAQFGQQPIKERHIAILAYPGVLNSALHGLAEMLLLANRCAAEQGLPWRFYPETLTWPDEPPSRWDAVLLPPAMDDSGYGQENEALNQWLRQCHGQGALIASACAGAFLLAAAGLDRGRPLTTHWGLEAAFRQRFAKAKLDCGQIMIDQGDIISAGGMMSWLELGFALVARLGDPALVSQLGKLLVVDTGVREQRFYRRFEAKLNHGDSAIAGLQTWLEQQLHGQISVVAMAGYCHMTPRTLQRRFLKATGLQPAQYLLELRMQRARERLESGNDSFECIATELGYEDVSACRRAFTRLCGLSPGEYRRRFRRSG